MALDNRSIVITLKLDSGDSEAEQNPTNTEGKKQSSDKDKGKAIAAFAVIQGVELVASEIVSWAEYYWNKDLTLNDDYVGQRNKRIATTYINRAVSDVTTIGSSIAAGAAVGQGIGAIVGAVIGVSKVISSTVRSNIQGQEQQDIAIRQMDAQLQFTRSRAGWSLNAASIGEDL